MSTKIKSHRIDDKAIQNKHLADEFSLSEGSRVVLNHATHDNANDLSHDQYLILTQGGNGDIYHYHTGGSGGAEGIYTHAQIDASLLKIMMQLNSIKYGIEHSIMDLFDNDSGVDYGVPAPTVDTSKLTVTTDVTTLTPNTIYQYEASIKVKDGWTNLSASAKLITPVADSLYRKAQLTFRMPADYVVKAIKIFRTKSSSDFAFLGERSYTTLYSPEGFIYELIPKEGSNMETTALRLSVLGTSTDSLKDISDVAYGGKWIGPNVKNVLYQGAGIKVVYGFSNLDTTNKPGQLTLQWNSNIAYIPLDYIVEYSKTLNPNISLDSQWAPISDLRILDDFTATAMITDGAITNGTVVNNTRITNKFSFKPIPGCTGIRVRILRQISGVNLAGLYVYHLGASVGQKIYDDLGKNYNITPYKTMVIEVDSNGLMAENLNIGLIGAVDSGVVTAQTNAFSHTANNTTQGVNLNRTIREEVYVGAMNYNGFNKIKLAWNSNTANNKISNVTIALSNNGLDSPIITMPQTLKRVTFNNGQLNSAGVASTTISSDWIQLDFPVGNFVSFIVTYTIEIGLVYWHSQGNRYSWYKDGNVGGDMYNTDGAGFIGTTK